MPNEILNGEVATYLLVFISVVFFTVFWYFDGKD